jgi:hypothetical protein
MKKKLISEVSRIQELMGKSIISEQATVPKFLKSIFAMLGDDAVKKSVKLLDDEVDNAINSLRKGETISDDILEKLLKNLDWSNISKTILDGKLLGSAFDSKIDEAIEFIKNNPSKYNSTVLQFNNTLDKLPFLQDAPVELIDELKIVLKSKIDDGIKGVSKVIDVSLDDALRNLFGQNIESIVEGTRSVDDIIKEFLQQNGKTLSKFYNPNELKLYVEQMTGALRQVIEKSSKLDSVYTDLSKVWGKMTLVQQREFAKKSIEGITKQIPFGFKDLFDVKKLTDYVVKGADNEFSLPLFWKRIRNIWAMSVAIQAVGLLYKASVLTAQQKKGYELTWDQKIEEILNGRSMQEFAFDILVPPVNWVATLISSLDRDTQFDELKSQLPITARDNVFRNESGEGYYIKQAGVVYPLELKNNQWAVQIEGQWYKLSDVEGF